MHTKELWQIKKLDLGVISYDKQILAQSRSIAGSFGMDVKPFNCFAEYAAKEGALHIGILVIDMDANAGDFDELKKRMESLKTAPQVMLIGGTEISPWNSLPMPPFVKRIVVREGGLASFKNALKDQLNALLLPRL